MRTEPTEFHTFSSILSLPHRLLPTVNSLGSKVIPIFLFCLFSSYALGQTFTFSGGVENDNGTAESGVTVTAKSGGTTVESDKTTTSGRYKLELPYGKNYTIEITKPGFGKRFYNVDLSNVKEESLSSGEDYASQNIKLFTEAPGVDLTPITSKPITNYTFDKKSGMMVKDVKLEAETLKAEQAIKTQKDKADSGGGVNKQELEKQLKEKIKAGDAAFAAKDYEKAEKTFLDAVAFANKNKLDDAEAQDKLIKAEDENRKKRDAEIKDKQENAELFKLLDEAKKLEAKKDFLKAKEKLEEAKAKKPDNKEVNELLAKVTQALADQAAEEKKNADYQAAMTAGNQLFDTKDYTEALKKFEEAKALKPSEKDPPIKIAATQSKINDQKNEAEKLANFEALLGQAESLKSAAKYDEAIKKFEEAQVIYKDRQEPKEGIEFCKTKKKEAEDIAKNQAEEAKRNAEYQAALKKADDLFKAEKLKEAIKEYEAALKFKPEEEYPKTQITAANDKLNEQAIAEEKKKQFEQLKKDGEKAFASKNYPDAKDKYTQANAIQANDPVVVAKLAEIEKIEKENAANQAKEDQYKDLMTRGETALSAETYTEAKDLFNQASALKPNEPLPKQKLEIIDKKLKEQAADLAKKQQFDALVNSASNKESNKDLKGALDDLNKAYELIKDAQVKTKIEQIQADITNAANAEKRKKEYDEAISKADAARNAKEWEKAIALYKDAQKIDAAQSYPGEQIVLAETEINKLKSAQERLNNFKRLSADAEKQFKDKKFKEAETIYKEALSLADAEQDIKSTNEKIAEIAKILDQIDGEARKEQAFNDAMNAAQSLEKEDKLKEALEKYREAKKIKPEVPLPGIKENEIVATLEKREQEAKKKAAFEALMAAGDELFVAGKFKDAIKKFEEAKPIYPENKQPQEKIDEVNKKIEALANDAKEQAYQKILTDAENKRMDGKLDEAITIYKRALQERPNDAIPTEKIKEIEAEIAEIKRKEAELAAKRKRYAELLSAGLLEFDKKELKKALDIYTEAQQLLPDEASEATKKIEQINNILATQEAEKQAELEKQRQLNELIASGDLAFKQDKYQEALDIYNQAKTQAPANEVILQKIKITQDRLEELEKSRLEKLQRDKLVAADKAFADRNYDLALTLYQELLELKPDHKKAKEQIALIERIKTPASEISDLPDLGTPSMYSILEGEALLSQSGRQTEYKRLKKMRDQIVEIDQNRLNAYNMDSEKARESWLKTKGIEGELEEDASIRNAEQWITEQIIREKLGNLSDKELFENILAYKDLLDAQEQLRNISLKYVDGVNGNVKVPNMNEEEIKEYLKTALANRDNASSEQLELLLKNEAYIKSLADPNKSDEELHKLLTTINSKLLIELFYSYNTSTPAQLEARQEYLNKVINTMDAYAADLNERNTQAYERSNNIGDQVNQIKDGVYDENQKTIAKNNDNRRKTLELLMEFDEMIREEKKSQNSTHQSSEQTVIKLQNNSTDAWRANMTKNYLRLQQEDQKIKQLIDFESEDYKLWENEVTLAYTELKEINRRVLLENDRIKDDKQKLAYKNTKDINELVVQRSDKMLDDHSKQTETAKSVQSIDRSAADAQKANLEKAKKTTNENRALLDQLERKDFKITDAILNKLGEQFPEGVTEENFVTKDDDDIVVEVKTRRIVVVNGGGNVYMRYSNRFGVTYTKNNTPITEYQWTKETQNAKLPKYKIN